MRAFLGGRDLEWDPRPSGSTYDAGLASGGLRRGQVRIGGRWPSVVGRHDGLGAVRSRARSAGRAALPIPLSTGAGSATMEACDPTDRRGHTCPPRAGTRQLPCRVLRRDAELARLADLLSRAGSGSAAVAVIRGETGCGKTHLLNAVAERARAEGWKCLNVQGVESEAVLSGAGLLSVLSPLRAGLGSVPEAQAEALSAALGWGPAAGSGDRFLIGAATLSLLAAESSRTPLLIAVDDVQWVDVESADALAFAARRLGHDRVAVVMTHRVGDAAPGPAGRLRDHHRRRPRTGSGASPARAGLLGRRRGHAGVRDRRQPACPAGVSAGAQPRAARGGGPAACRPFPFPSVCARRYASELGDLSPGAWRAAVLCAASSDQEAAPVLEALAAEGLDPGTCLAEAGDVLVAQGGVLTFRHPMLRSATWERASVSERVSAHALACRRHPGPGRSGVAPRGGDPGPRRSAGRRAGGGRRRGPFTPRVRRRLEGHGTRGPAHSRPRASR